MGGSQTLGYTHRWWHSFDRSLGPIIGTALILAGVVLSVIIYPDWNHEHKALVSEANVYTQSVSTYSCRQINVGMANGKGHTVAATCYEAHYAVGYPAGSDLYKTNLTEDFNLTRPDTPPSTIRILYDPDDPSWVRVDDGNTDTAGFAIALILIPAGALVLLVSSIVAKSDI